MSSIAHIYAETETATTLNNEANMLENNGDLEGAVRKHIQAIEIKTNATGEQSIQVAFSKNALGELYLKMGEIEKAQGLLEEAYEIRRQKPFLNDAAVTRENLGRLWEAKGDLLRAREIRTVIESQMACGNTKCPGMNERAGLKKCSKCKSVWYHHANCQRKDWARHKKYCKDMEA